jgi:hypothetical protein
LFIRQPLPPELQQREISNSWIALSVDFVCLWVNDRRDCLMPQYHELRNGLCERHGKRTPTKVKHRCNFPLVASAHDALLALTGLGAAVFSAT